ncbi:MAG: RdgB/HAM1 family non-canonical purine NTP pyrophosphatase [Pseudomonadota bacterium]
MPRRFTEPRLVVASHNEGKVSEIRALLVPYGVETVSAGELDLPVPEETETTFAGNALIKARAACAASGLPALADDSGIEIDALDGAPGIYTADWAETPNGRDFLMAMTRAWTEVQEKGAAPPHAARFNACLALVWPDGHDETFLGIAPGTLTWPPRGDKGFGYDPMFVPDAGDGRTFGEMPHAEKEAISHRTDAFRQLKAAFEASP